MSKTSKSFEFSSCNFKVQKEKEGTARIVVNKEFNVLNSFTLETSFCGATIGDHQDFHFTPPIMENVGADFCKALLAM